MAMDPAGLIFALHSELLRGIADATGRHFQGLAQASRQLPGLAARQRRALLHVDISYNMVRHMSAPRSRACVFNILGALHSAAAPEEIVHVPMVIPQRGGGGVNEELEPLAPDLTPFDSPSRGCTDVDVSMPDEFLLRADAPVFAPACKSVTVGPVDIATFSAELTEEKLLDKLEGYGKEKTGKAVMVSLDWFGKNLLAEKDVFEANTKEEYGSCYQPAEKDDFEAELRELEDVTFPSVMKDPFERNMATYVSNTVMEVGAFAGASFGGERLSDAEYSFILGDTSEDAIHTLMWDGYEGDNFIREIIREFHRTSDDYSDGCG